MRFFIFSSLPTSGALSLRRLVRFTPPVQMPVVQEMRSVRWIWCVVALALVLTGCVAPVQPERTILVSLIPTEGCIIPANGQRVEPGDDALFELALEQGYAISRVDYDGEYEYFVRDGREYLRLVQVRYPTRVRLVLTNRFNTIRYEPNGGQGEALTCNYDLRLRSRPNTELGTDRFSRDGYTLVGWNSAPDGSGQQIGLGSRVSIPPQGLTLFAQWVRWSEAGNFSFRRDGEDLIIIGYTGSEQVLAVPQRCGGRTVTGIAAGAFSGCPAQTVILPTSLRTVEAGAFSGSAVQELVLFDSIDTISAAAFSDCTALQTLRINAVERPWGNAYRKESCLADKADLLIEARGQRKLVFYGGCSVWYNLDGEYARQQLGQQYRVINAGVNGFINSALQLQIITACMEPGDVFFHTPELSSCTQLMQVTGFSNQDDKLWCGLELNYDLLTLVDARDFPELLDSWNRWQQFRQHTGGYDGCYRDEQGRLYLDSSGSIPFYRDEQVLPLQDRVVLDPEFLQPQAMEQLEHYYDALADRGVRVYVSYACVNLDALPVQQRQNVGAVDEAMHGYFAEMDSAVLISSLSDYCYGNDDFYDTNYHLLSRPAYDNTVLWLRDLKAQMQTDGIWLAQS